MASFGKEIIDGLQEFAEALESGERVSEKFTCHKMVLHLEPTRYDPELVKRTRGILNVSQTVFAQFLGVSRSTVQAWEHGDNPVTGAAGRLMDEIRENPEYFRKRLMSMAERKDGDLALH